ncbi:ABC transporter permease [Actinomadura spongiicola]|uniref:ABC transporter permease n=1 Tax=Actinomadura spongiicola TaxID=2303421 RepID=A0A372GHB3_9ACTN|nr:ABC transporter permease subunit [Actinomadura spongiicola]RFS84499.1 ABC transporter permease [Actinomadura spongiicola]
MIWLTLRQFRVQAAVVFGGLAVLCAALAITGPGMADEFNSGFASCTAQGDCSRFTRRFFEDHEMAFGAVILIVAFLPGLIGIFWGAPLITREIEQGTHRLVWNQSITRTRWLAVKLAVVGVAAMVAAGLAALAADWWSDPIDKAASDDISRITPLVFLSRGIVPIGYAAFAFALGVTVGVIVRRTLPAMAITLAVFVGLQVAVPMWIRPNIIPAESKIVAITSENHGEMMMMREEGDKAFLQVEVEPEPRAWTFTNETVDSSGKKVGRLPVSVAAGAPCAPPPPGPDGEPPEGPSQACFDDLAKKGYKQKVAYHPADRFWPLQWAETGLFVVLALGLTGLCFYWTRRRLS